MRSADQILARLADPVARGALLGPAELDRIAAVCYEVDPAGFTGPTTAVYDSLDLIVSPALRLAVRGRWSRLGDPMASEGQWQLDWPGDGSPYADAVWAGHLAVRTGGADGVITAAAGSWSAMSAAEQTAGVQVTYAAPPIPALADPPAVLPVLVAFHVADAADFSLRALLQATARSRRALEATDSGYTTASPPVGAPQRIRRSCACWLLPPEVFDDAGWPVGGAGPAGTPDQQRAARLAAAQAWLAPHGVVALVSS